MQMTFWPFWLMIVSLATAALQVWRSPMISSRWPRPMGIMASTALRPVWGDSRGPCDDVPFAHPEILAHEHRAHVLLFEVERHAHDAARELQELAGHDIVEPEYLG